MSDDRKSGEAQFTAEVRKRLDAQSLAPEWIDRLAAARARAVASVEMPRVRVPSNWITAGALATTLLLVGVGVVFDTSPVPLDDEQQLAAVAEMDLLIDLEFVAWLDADDIDAG